MNKATNNINATSPYTLGDLQALMDSAQASIIARIALSDRVMSIVQAHESTIIASLVRLDESLGNARMNWIPAQRTAIHAAIGRTFATIDGCPAILLSVLAGDQVSKGDRESMVYRQSKAIFDAITEASDSVRRAIQSSGREHLEAKLGKAGANEAIKSANARARATRKTNKDVTAQSAVEEVKAKALSMVAMLRDMSIASGVSLADLASTWEATFAPKMQSALAKAPVKVDDAPEDTLQVPKRKTKATVTK